MAPACQGAKQDRSTPEALIFFRPLSRFVRDGLWRCSARAFQTRLHQTSIEGPTRTVRDALRPGALRQVMLAPAAPLEIHRLPFDSGDSMPRAHLLPDVQLVTLLGEGAATR